MFRKFITIACVSLAITFVESCGASKNSTRVSSRPHAPTQSISPGTLKLGLADNRDGLVFVPSNYDSAKAMPLLVLLHGAGQSAEEMTRFFSLAEKMGVIIIVPDSRARTWDAVLSDFGEDVSFLDKALAYIFDHCRIDPK
ncbi:MAG: hypothetical protein HY088_05140 [Ignavibacteriales bacterium]|nr:hypothetical protein [Ignavibacteriales bacterium]